MADLAALWEEYKQAVRAGGDALGLYQERIWPALLERWRQDPPVHPSPLEFEVSVHTLGTSPEATVLAILGTRAREVYVLHTEMTRTHLARLRRETGREVYPLLIEKSDVAAIYRHVRDLLERFSQVPVALDLTSGTKAMSAGLAAAGFFFQRFYPKVRVVYVDNEEYDAELRRPRAGTERLIILPNPHEVVGEVEALFAREYYEKGEFARAADRFGALVGKAWESRHYEPYNLLAQMYAAWYALNFSEALKKGQALLDRLGKDLWLRHPLNGHRRVLEGQVEVLRAANQFLAAQDLANTRGVFGVVETLLNLSERWERASLALAALHAYRALELLLQERLFGHGRRAEAPGLTEGEREALRGELARILGLPEGEVRLGPRLGLLDLVALLRVLGDPLLSGDLARLQGLAGVLKARNDSLLVHGFRVPSEKEVGQIRSLARPLHQDLRERAGVEVSLTPLSLGMPL